MILEQETLIRNKITGVLLRQARLHAGVDLDQCAAALSRAPAFIQRAEEGQEALTLPQLESLARELDLPIQCLLGEQDLPARRTAADPAYYEQFMALRRKIVGVMLQQARAETDQTLDDAAGILGWEPERLRRVEWGEEAISLAELQVLAGALGISVGAFVDPGEPAPPPETPREARARGTQPLFLPAEERASGAAPILEHLPEDVQEFVVQPINAPYLQVAMGLSQMPAQILRRIASGLFEITY